MVVERIQEDEAGGQFREDIDLIDRIVQTVKRICTELRPALLDHIGLGAAIEWQVGEFQKRSGMECDVSSIPADFHVNMDLSAALFRIFQKARTNVLRHAEATRVEATLFEDDRNLLKIVCRYLLPKRRGHAENSPYPLCLRADYDV